MERSSFKDVLTSKQAALLLRTSSFHRELDDDASKSGMKHLRTDAHTHVIIPNDG
jgi:hypothetical protein